MHRTKPAPHLRLLLLIAALGLAMPGIARSRAAEPDPTAQEDAQGPTPALFPLERYRPIYFLVGRPQTKVMISFKIPIVQGTGIYFAYTGLIFWELFKESSPFLDMDHSPEIFYRMPLRLRAGDSLDLGFWKHESNGKGGADSRSWDRTYVRYEHGASEPGRRFVGWSAQAGIAYRLDHPNPDLRRYRGLYELELVLSGFLGHAFEVNDLSFRLRPGGRWGIDPLHGAQEITLRVKNERRRFRLPLTLQVFHGFAENLLQYREEHWGFRAGLGF